VIFIKVGNPFTYAVECQAEPVEAGVTINPPSTSRLFYWVANLSKRLYG